MGDATIPSRRFGSYRLVRKLGEGGMAEVFQAEAIEQDRFVPVALKFMKPQTDIPGADAQDLFATEADVMGMLRHPNLVELYEVGKHDERMFLAMEYVPGGDLGQVMAELKAQERPFPASAALRIGIDVLKALAYLHQAETVRGTPLGLVHGDLNPSNIFLSAETGQAKLGDFGVVTASGISALPEGMAAGKLHYLSPEQVQGKPLTGCSDLFAVAVVMFELLLGMRPFDGRTQDDVLERIAAGKFHKPDEMSDALEALFARGLARHPKNRFPTAGAFAAELLRYQLDTNLQCTHQDVRELVTESLLILI
ncbi:MAG: serine/threonine-protein kinase [Myxococcales bacterium]